MKTFSDCASRRKNRTSIVAQYEPVLDEKAFQQLLAAAYALQEHTKSLPGIEAEWDRPKGIPDPLIEPPHVEPIRIPPVTPVDEQTQIGRADEPQILSQGRQIRIILSVHSKRMRRRAKASALPVLILFIIVGFLLSMPWRHYPANIVAEAPSKTAPFAGLLKLDTTIRPKSQATSDNTQTDSPSLKSSHLRVTDSATASVLEALSRYEIKTLRRQAEYGDQTAAVDLGMAYEMGRYVPQNCSKAAYWVAMAATEGNAAAQYNLGLRYLYGDGISTNPQEGKDWLEKAAARHYPKAESALQKWSVQSQPN